jgi:hypothetical protein
MSERTGSSGQILPHPYAYNAHGPGRCQFSVLCWRGWCDSNYRDREIGAMIGLVSGVAWPPATGLPARQCPTPGTCDCECHDGESR